MTKPSPETAEPTNVFADLSTVKFNVLVHAIAIGPSIETVSLFNSIIINSLNGIFDSRQIKPLPLRTLLNNPSANAAALEKLVLLLTIVNTI